MARGTHRKPGAPGLPGAGPPRQYLTIRVRIDSGLIPVALPADAMLLAQQLMLRDWPGVTTIEDLISYALRRLADCPETRP